MNVALCVCCTTNELNNRTNDYATKLNHTTTQYERCSKTSFENNKNKKTNTLLKGENKNHMVGGRQVLATVTMQRKIGKAARQPTGLCWNLNQ